MQFVVHWLSHVTVSLCNKNEVGTSCALTRNLPLSKNANSTITEHDTAEFNGLIARSAPISRSGTHLFPVLCRIGLASAIFLLIVNQPMEVFLSGRDVQLVSMPDYIGIVEAPFVARLLKTVAIALAFLALVSSRNTFHVSNPQARDVFVALLIYFMTSMLFNAAFGHVATFPPISNICFLLVLSSIYACRDQGYDHLIDAARNGLLVLMVASLICNVAYPDMTRRYFDDEIRLPFIDYRFWGLSEHANAIAPMATTLLLLIRYHPFSRPILTWLAFGLTAAVLLLAQSQTSWLATLLVVPAMPIFARLTCPSFLKSRLLIVPLIIIGLSGGVALLAGPPNVQWISDTTLAIGDQVMTGRGRVWQIAVETFLNNPIFGYGLTAWDDDFRHQIGLPWAVHAHNQFLNTLSTSGLIGLTGFLYYFGILMIASARAAKVTRGLAPALAINCVLQSITEVPFDLGRPQLVDNVAHVLLFALVVSSKRDTGNSVSVDSAPLQDAAGAMTPTGIVIRRAGQLSSEAENQSLPQAASR